MTGQPELRGLTARPQWTGVGRWWLEDWISHICLWICQEEKQEQDKPGNPGFQYRGIKLQTPLAVKSCGGCGGGRTSQPHRRVPWRDP